MGVFLRAVTNMGLHRRVIHVIRAPLFAKVALRNPRFALKYLFPDYLVKSFTVEERVSCFVHHHSRMHAVLPESLLRQVLRGQATLCEIPCPEHHLALTMGLSTPCDKEGEFSVNLQVDGETTYTLSFTIVPGRVVMPGIAELLLITRIQGTAGSYAKIKVAVKAMHDAGPDAALFAAVQGVATAFGVDTVAAVSAANQSSSDKDCLASFKRSYDEFYTGMGMEELPNGFFSGTIPVAGKPLALVRRSHRQRTREQRRIRQEIYSSCADSVLRAVNSAARSPRSLHSTQSESGALAQGGPAHS